MKNVSALKKNLIPFLALFSLNLSVRAQEGSSAASATSAAPTTSAAASAVLNKGQAGTAKPVEVKVIPFKEMHNVALEVLNSLKQDKISEKEADFQKMIYFMTLEEIVQDAKKANTNLYDYVSSSGAKKHFLTKVTEYTAKTEGMKEVEAFILLAKAEAEHSIIFSNLESEQEEVNKFIQKVSTKLGIE